MASEKKNERILQSIYELQLRSCKTILDVLLQQSNAYMFNAPVDCIGLGLDDYREIVKNPMDLGTVKNRLDRGYYATPSAFIDDVRLTFNNSMLYNTVGTDISRATLKMSIRFEELIANLIETAEDSESILGEFRVSNSVDDDGNVGGKRGKRGKRAKKRKATSAVGPAARAAAAAGAGGDQCPVLSARERLEIQTTLVGESWDGLADALGSALLRREPFVRVRKLVGGGDARVHATDITKETMHFLHRNCVQLEKRRSQREPVEEREQPEREHETEREREREREREKEAGTATQKRPATDGPLI